MGISGVGGVGGHLSGGGKVDGGADQSAVKGGEMVGGLVGNLAHGSVSVSKNSGGVIGYAQTSKQVGAIGEGPVSDRGAEERQV
jgi:hypothetical protein